MHPLGPMSSLFCRLAGGPWLKVLHVGQNDFVGGLHFVRRVKRVTLQRVDQEGVQAFADRIVDLVAFQPQRLVF